MLGHQRWVRMGRFVFVWVVFVWLRLGRAVFELVWVRLVSVGCVRFVLGWVGSVGLGVGWVESGFVCIGQQKWLGVAQVDKC